MKKEKNIKKIINLKNYIIISISTILLSIALTYLILTYIEKNKKYVVVFNLNEPQIEEIIYGNEYTELGCTLIVNDIDKTEEILIDTTNLDITKVGTYQVKYYIIINKKEYSIYRTVNVIDNINPTITLKGNKEIIILLDEEYIEPGYEAQDNYDKDITSKVTIENNLDITKEGTYEITYKVEDSSNNQALEKRIVTVKKPYVVTYEVEEENKEEVQEIDETIYKNTITQNKFTNTGIYLEGYINNETSTYKIKLSSDKEYIFDMTETSKNKYQGNIDITNIDNGIYNAYIVTDKEERLLNNMNFIDKLVRAKVGNKLLTVTYDNDNQVSIQVEDFAYLYDILIDPGHGGIDTGASNRYVLEKDMNLTVSLYEKCRYEAHGLKVYMTRTTDTYGEGMGISSLSKLHRRAYEMGYYGSVSKIVYSNHHNAIANTTYEGYEILIPAYLTLDDLQNELSIVNKFNQIYSLDENHNRFYARDYDTEKKYSKLDGTVYNFKDNYAINRIPYRIFNTKAIIYEGEYLTNEEAFKWYWQDANWYKVSEAKIEVYVTSLGITYNEDNTSCK